MKDRQGFTLIEISIVLVIIGLIVGGIIVGRDLIEAASQRQTVSQVQSLVAAIQTFKGKYKCLPGDCPRAVAFFGTQNNNVDGNGNGVIQFQAGLTAEGVRAFYHLQAAGLIRGVSRGPADIMDFVVGETIPPTPYGGQTRFSIRNSAAHWMPQTTFSWGGVFLTGRDDDTGVETWLLLDVQPVDPRLQEAIFNPNQLEAIDRKVDDGLPASGRLNAANESPNPNPDCTLNQSLPTASYNLTTTNRVCALAYFLGL